MSRNTHDRMTSHHGDLPDDGVGLTEAVGGFPVGTPVSEVLQWLSEAISAMESGARTVSGFKVESFVGYRLYIDAVLDQARLWRDALIRTGALGTTEGSSTFGPFAWKVTKSSTFTPDIVQDGIAPDTWRLIRGELPPSGEASIYGYPAIRTGEIVFEYTPANDGDDLEIGVQPHGEGARIKLESLGGYLYQLLLGDNPGIWVSIQLRRRFRIRFCLPGLGSIGFPENWWWWRTWYPDWEDEPGGWDWVYLDPQVGYTLPVITLTLNTAEPYIGQQGIGNLFVTKLDSDPWQMYEQISIDAVIV